MNTAKICVFGLALFCLCGCTDSHYEMKQVPPQLSQAEMSRTDIVKVGYELADGLIKNLHAPLNEGETVIVASFADVDNLTQSSTVEGCLGTSWVTLFTAGIYRCRYTYSAKLYFYSRAGWEFVLSRDVRALSKANNAACVVAGTFGRLGKSTVVSVRMIRASDNVILSSADGVLVRGR
ncbi:MAG: FlgO family outer membrane protein [Bilophila wadsworthia]